MCMWSFSLYFFFFLSDAYKTQAFLKIRWQFDSMARFWMKVASAREKYAWNLISPAGDI